MATIFKRGRVWYSKLKSNGKEIRKALSTDRRHAENKLADLIKQRDAARHFHAPSDLSWRSFKTQYLEQSKAEKKEQTWQGEARAFNQLERVFPINRLQQITPALLDRIRGKWLEAKRGKYVINRDLRSLKTAMYWAEKQGLAPKQDWASVKFIKVPKGRLHFLTATELKKLKIVCRGVWLTILYLGSRAGLRPAEIYWLEWGDIDFDRNRIHVSAKDHWVPKDYERRWIPMPPDLRSYLEKLQIISGGRVLGDKSEIPTQDSMTVYFKRLAKKAGLRATPYTLRHTYASHYVQNGGNIYKLKEYMGHSSVETTQIYAHLAPADADKTLETMPGLL